MNPVVTVMANRSLAFSFYDFYLEGLSAKELAAAYSIPIHYVQERIQAVRLCLQFQARAAVDTRRAFQQAAAAEDHRWSCESHSWGCASSRLARAVL